MPAQAIRRFTRWTTRASSATMTCRSRVLVASSSPSTTSMKATRCRGAYSRAPTGTVLRGPATAALRTYDVREKDGKMQVRI